MSTPTGFAHIVGANFVTVMIGTTTHTVRSDNHPNYAAIREAVRNHEWDAVEQLISISTAVDAFGKGEVHVQNGQVYYNGEVLHNSIVTRIINMIGEGFAADPLLKFLQNLMQNPSNSAVNELYDFLEKNSLPITEDGHFLAYKKVRSDYLDFYTGKVDHSIGSRPEMARNQVDDNRNNTCSHGLHFCSLEYLPKYHGGQGRVVIVKINPKDVVSIPIDYNHSKGRACTYEVVAEHALSENTEAFTRSVYASDGSEYEYIDTYAAEDQYHAGYEDGYYDCHNDCHEIEDEDNSPAYQQGYEDGWNQADADLMEDKADLEDSEDSEDDHLVEAGATASTAAVWDDPVIENIEHTVFACGTSCGSADASTGRSYGTTVDSYFVQVSASAFWRGYAQGWHAIKSQQG